MTQIPSLVSREPGTSQPASRSIRRRPSASHLLVALAVVLAFVLNILALQSQGTSVLVAVASEPIPAGAVFSPSMVRMVPVDSGFAGLGSLLTEVDAPARYGWIVQRPIGEGGVVELSFLVEAVSEKGFRSMSLPVLASRAAGGTIAAGDRVDVIAVRDEIAGFVVAGVEVLSVGGGGSGFGAMDHHLVVAVDANQALALAEAMAAGPIDVVRSTGAPGLEVVEDGP